MQPIEYCNETVGEVPRLAMTMVRDSGSMASERAVEANLVGKASLCSDAMEA